ncbi:MAG: hypothetical protein H0W88_06985 [Parachlamydiaceae bacterium]|nr:hypothetical protein [Parachlamydiaceae bacterium]
MAPEITDVELRSSFVILIDRHDNILIEEAIKIFNMMPNTEAKAGVLAAIFRTKKPEFIEKFFEEIAKDKTNVEFMKKLIDLLSMEKADHLKEQRTTYFIVGLAHGLIESGSIKLKEGEVRSPEKEELILNELKENSVKLFKNKQLSEFIFQCILEACKNGTFVWPTTSE